MGYRNVSLTLTKDKFVNSVIFNCFLFYQRLKLNSILNSEKYFQ